MLDKASKANNASLLDLDTIDKISSNIQKSYELLGKQQEEGYRIRAESFAKIRQAEAVIDAAKEKYHERQIKNASMIISGHAEVDGSGSINSNSSSLSDGGNDFLASLQG